MIDKIDIEKILFLDIETVSQYRTFSELKPRFQKLWKKKAAILAKNETETPEILYEKAAIYAEFGKIICISAGFFRGSKFRIKSFFGHDEKALLQDFTNMINSSFDKSESLLCAHNGKEFDFPYIARRQLINGIRVPKIFDLRFKKPWEVQHLDTMELWSFGDRKSYTSLDLLSAVFDIPTPKDDISGAMVGAVYWQENDLDRIERYCKKDVITIARLFQKYRGEQAIDDADILDMC